MKVILFRHGPAGRRDSSRWPDDVARPLTSRGEARTRLVARGLARLEPRIGAILTSPLERASATARVLQAATGTGKPEILEALAPRGSYRQIVEALASRASDETVVLVGHEPGLGKLAGTLLFGAPAALPLKKAGACAISFVGPPLPGKGQLAWFLPPRTLRRMARKKGTA
jgi:phosphohistidine phosphatase